MSKYKCTACMQDAHYIEFSKSEENMSVTTVYAYCTDCNKEAWGGLNFHPEMNAYFNTLFEANLNFQADKQDLFSRNIVLQSKKETR